MGTQTADQIIEKILSLPEGTKLYIMAPVARKGQEKYDTLFDDIRRSGFSRMRIDGTSHTLDEPPAIDHRRKHTVEVVIDRNVVKPGTRTRISEAVEQALDLGRGVVHLAHVEAGRPEPEWRVEVFSQHLACGTCGTSYDPLNPHHYSFNSPLGWCPTCEGLGFQRGANQNLLIGDGRLTVRQGAVTAWPPLRAGSAFLPFAEAVAAHAGFTLDTPWDALTPAHQRAVLQGTGDAWLSLSNADGGMHNAEAKPDGKKGTRTAKSDTSPLPIPHSQFQYKGLYPAIDEANRVSFSYRMRLEHIVDEVPCVACRGSRLRPDAAATRYAGRTVGELCGQSLGDTLAVFQNITLAKREKEAVGEVVREVIDRAKFLVDVGLDYLSLDRRSPTLSGGEGQRIRLASQIGSGLTGVLYVLDEPTIGLHPRDNARLLTALHRLRDLGNTLVLVEHDREVIASADYLLDFGPGAGDQGGEITAAGTPAEVRANPASLTGQYLTGTQAIPVPSNRRIPNGGIAAGDPTADEVAALSPQGAVISVVGARQHNLRNVDVSFPLGALIAVTGVSGSGKSTLVNEVLYNTLARKLHRAQTPGAAHDEVRGLGFIDKIINVDQDPIGNAPSSNPATYTGLFDLVRELFTRLPESKLRGYTGRRFSFNQKGGRCEACEGDGQKKIEMHFLPDVWVECDVCHGRRYNPETLLVLYHGHSIADILDMRVNEALKLFHNIPKIRIVLQTLSDVGLGYMALGQPAPTMSGGEAQRVKLAAELARPSTGRTLYLLDEPTTGLHFDDVRKLLDVLHRLADLGNTVVVVEHNLDVIKTADWVIDMGPDAGVGGGTVVAQGPPERVAAVPESHTGRILAGVLAAGPHAARPTFDAKAARKAKIDDIDITQVGKDEKLPWELDGVKWHTADRVTTRGTAVKWDGAALAHVVAAVEARGRFGPPDWANRGLVEVAAPVRSHGWFLHALTGHEAYLTLTFRVGRNTFKGPDLAAKLGLKPLSDIKGLENYSRDVRVEVNNPRGPWQEAVVTITALAEVQTPAFGQFLTEAADSFAAAVGRMQAGPDASMPWKLDGEKWHLSAKGFPPGKPTKWDAGLLPKLVGVIRAVAPAAEFKWDSQDAVLVKIPGVGQSWARLKTKDPAALEAKFVGRPGQFNLARFDGVGRAATLTRDRANGAEVLAVEFVTADHLTPAGLTPLLREHLAGFRATFGAEKAG